MQFIRSSVNGFFLLRKDSVQKSKGECFKWTVIICEYLEHNAQEVIEAKHDLCAILIVSNESH